MTQEVGKIFCPKCGNGGTLRKVSVTVGENGIMMASRRPRVTLRGTKVSVFMLLVFLLSRHLFMVVVEGGSLLDWLFSVLLTPFYMSS